MSPLRFSLPLDNFQRELATEALRRAGAPFDPDPGESFRAGVRRVWQEYQQLRGERAPAGALAAAHRLDRALYVRDREEHMDDPTLPDARRRRIIRGLDRMNWFYGFYFFLFRALRELLEGVDAAEVSVLDIGSGHGAFPIRLAARRRLGPHELRVTGSDVAPAYLDEARRAAEAKRVSVTFRPLDALRLHEIEERYDVITCTQAAHHFPPDMLAEIMVRARAAARRGVLFFDVRRSALALAGVIVGSAFAGFGDPLFVHDGRVSVRRMYSPAELELLARCAPNSDYRAANFGPYYVAHESRVA